MSGASCKDNNSSVFIFQGKEADKLTLWAIYYMCALWLHIHVRGGLILSQYQDQYCKGIRRKYILVNCWNPIPNARTRQIIDLAIIWRKTNLKYEKWRMEIHVRNYLKEYMSQLIQRYRVSTIPTIRYEIKPSSITSLSTTQ